MVTVRLERGGRGGRRRVHRAVAARRGGEAARRGPHQVEEALGVVDPVLHRDPGESGLEGALRVREERGDGAQPFGKGVDALVRGAQLPHQQREDAGDDLEDGAGLPLRGPAQLERAQPPAHDLQRGERVHGRARVHGGQQRRETPLVLVQQLPAACERRR